MINYPSFVHCLKLNSTFLFIILCTIIVKAQSPIVSIQLTTNSYDDIQAINKLYSELNDVVQYEQTVCLDGNKMRKCNKGIFIHSSGKFIFKGSLTSKNDGTILLGNLDNKDFNGTILWRDGSAFNGSFVNRQPKKGLLVFSRDFYYFGEVYSKNGKFVPHGKGIGYKYFGKSSAVLESGIWKMGNFNSGDTRYLNQEDIHIRDKKGYSGRNYQYGTLEKSIKNKNNELFNVNSKILETETKYNERKEQLDEEYNTKRLLLDERLATKKKELKSINREIQSKKTELRKEDVAAIRKKIDYEDSIKELVTNKYLTPTLPEFEGVSQTFQRQDYLTYIDNLSSHFFEIDQDKYDIRNYYIKSMSLKEFYNSWKVDQLMKLNLDNSFITLNNYIYIVNFPSPFTSETYNVFFFKMGNEYKILQLNLI